MLRYGAGASFGKQTLMPLTPSRQFSVLSCVALLCQHDHDQRVS